MRRVLALLALLLAIASCGIATGPSDSELQAYAWERGFSREGSSLQKGGGRLHLKLNEKCDGELYYYFVDALFSTEGEYRLEVKKRGELIDTIAQKNIPSFVGDLRNGNVGEKLKGACLGTG